MRNICYKVFNVFFSVFGYFMLLFTTISCFVKKNKIKYTYLTSLILVLNGYSFTQVSYIEGFTGLFSVAVGYGSLASDCAVELGHKSDTAPEGVALGYSSYAAFNLAVLSGYSAVIADYTIAIGFGAFTSLDNSMVLGGNSVQNRVSVGIGTNAPIQKAWLT